jgi:Ring finger domain
MSYERINRAKKQRMYLLDYGYSKSDKEFSFKIEGSTGTPYGVHINEENFWCTCPDHQRRLAVCKHLFFIANRVFHSEDLVGCLKDREYSNAATILKGLYPRLSDAEATTHADNSPAVARDPHCCICYDDFDDSCEPELCRNRHGFHAECMDRWRAQKLDESRHCPVCRGAMKHRARAHSDLSDDDALTKLCKHDHVEETVASMFRDVSELVAGASEAASTGADSPQQCPSPHSSAAGSAASSCGNSSSLSSGKG